MRLPTTFRLRCPSDVRRARRTPRQWLRDLLIGTPWWRDRDALQRAADEQQKAVDEMVRHMEDLIGHAQRSAHRQSVIENLRDPQMHKVDMFGNCPSCREAIRVIRAADDELAMFWRDRLYEGGIR